MNCSTCRHWQGHRYVHWADCYWIIGQIEPKLFEEKNDFDFSFNVPFDPNDYRYYNSARTFHALLHRTYIAASKKDGVRVLRQGKLKFIQTHKDFGKECKYYEFFNMV